MKNLNHVAAFAQCSFGYRPLPMAEFDTQYFLPTRNPPSGHSSRKGRTGLQDMCLISINCLGSELMCRPAVSPSPQTLLVGGGGEEKLWTKATVLKL